MFVILLNYFTNYLSQFIRLSLFKRERDLLESFRLLLEQVY